MGSPFQPVCNRLKSTHRHGSNVTQAQSPVLQILIVRIENVKVEVEDGAARQLGPADMALEEDLTRRGHRGIPVDDQTVVFSAVALG